MDTDKTALGVIDNGEQTQAFSAPASNATQMAMNVNCPVCRTPNPPSEVYCTDCGFVLSSAPVDAVDMPEAPSVGKLVTTDGIREFPLNLGANTVGRENSDILLAHNTVSRKHAVVTVEEGRAYVEDSGSSNGTIVAGVKIAPGEKADLTDGCDLTFGSFTLKYQAPEQADAAATEEAAPPPEKTEMIAPEQTAESVSPEDTLDLPAADDTLELGPASEEMPAEEPEAKPAGRLISKDGALSFDIQDGANSIGRREGDNAIVIPDPYCSGRHADLTAADGAFTLTDIGSTNGTCVNGVKLEINAPREVQAGDEITLGRTVFRLEV